MFLKRPNQTGARDTGRKTQEPKYKKQIQEYTYSQ